MREGAIAPWAHRESYQFYTQLEAFADYMKFDLQTPYKDLSKDIKKALLYGVKEKIIPLEEVTKKDTKVKTLIDFEGVIPYLDRKLEEAEAASVYNDLRRYIGENELLALQRYTS